MEELTAKDGRNEVFHKLEFWIAGSKLRQFCMTKPTYYDQGNLRRRNDIDTGHRLPVHAGYATPVGAGQPQVEALRANCGSEAPSVSEDH